MGEETIKKVLRNSGLTEKEAEVYIFLSRHNVSKGTEIARLLRKDKSQVYRILKRLQTKGFIEETLEYPKRFTVIPFERILDSLVKIKQDEVTLIKEAKKDLINYLSKKHQVETSLEKFVVIKGNKRIYSKISKIIQDTKNQLSFATTIPDLMRANHFGVFDATINQHKPPIQYRFLTELSKQNLNAFKALVKNLPKKGFNFKSRNPELGLELFPRMVIRDNEEVLFFISRIDRREKESIALWTNCNSLVQAFGAIFEKFWRNSTDIKKKISEIETGKPISKTCIMTERETSQIYHETLKSAQENIMLVTSSKGLIQYSKQELLIEKWKTRGVRVRLMAPIVKDNYDAMQRIQKIFEVRHIPENFMMTTIVDDKHLFQFKTLPTDMEITDSISNNESTFYTNEIEYVEKMKNTLYDIWKNARVPSNITIEGIIGSYGPTLGLIPENATLSKTNNVKIIDVKPQGIITEKKVLNKIIHARKTIAKDPSKDVSRMFASIGVAVIHPPDFFNLPEMVILVNKIDKKSTFGAEDALNIFLSLESSIGTTYVPVATVGDNPQGHLRRKAIFAGTPAGRNVQLVSEDKLQVLIHGNIMFAGWTVPIPLYPPSYVLPPACLLIEGYGNVKTCGFTMLHSSGFRSKIEENCFDAFVTFIHSSSKYSGPGTDGVFARDYIMTNFPPKT